MACRTKSHSTELARAKSATRLAGLEQHASGWAARPGPPWQSKPNESFFWTRIPAVKLCGLFPGIVEGAMVGLAQPAE
jgi:hypothetical protein